MQPLSGNHHPDLPTAPMKMSLVLRLPRKMHLCRSSSNVPPAIVFGNATKPSRFAHFWQGAESLAPATQTTFEPSKVVRACGAFNILTWKCASCQNGAHFFGISTSKSGPCMVCCVHFDFETCFAPQRLPLFRQLNFQKCSEREVLLVFSLADVLRVLFVAHLAWWLRARRFSEPTFQPSGATNHYLATFLPFRSPASSFFSLFLFSDLLSSALLLSDSSHLCFSICPYCRKFDF